jgi:hypothetical protein
LFCHPESEAKAAKHKGLGRQKGFPGAPGLGFFDSDGEAIVQVPAAVHSIAQFRRYEQRARQLLQWRAAVAKGDARAAASLLIAQLEERQLDPRTAMARRSQLRDENPVERARLDELLLDLRIAAEIAAVHDDPVKRCELGGAYLRMLANGPRPSAAVTRGFWMVILEHCTATADAKGFATGLDGMRGEIERTSGGAEWGAKMLAEYERTLARLRAGK